MKSERWECCPARSVLIRHDVQLHSGELKDPVFLVLEAHPVIKKYIFFAPACRAACPSLVWVAVFWRYQPQRRLPSLRYKGTRWWLVTRLLKIITQMLSWAVSCRNFRATTRDLNIDGVLLRCILLAELVSLSSVGRCFCAVIQQVKLCTTRSVDYLFLLGFFKYIFSCHLTPLFWREGCWYLHSSATYKPNNLNGLAALQVKWKTCIFDVVVNCLFNLQGCKSGYLSSSSGS